MGWFENPCGIDDPAYGPPCLMELGDCLTCGERSDLPWAAMKHEFYGESFKKYLSYL